MMASKKKPQKRVMNTSRWVEQRAFAEEVGLRVRERMQELGLNAMNVAARCECHLARIEQIKRGDGCPSLYLGIQLAAALDVTIDWLAGLSESKN